MLARSSRISALLWLLAGCLAFFYAYLSQRIDFHPDEAIYFDAIPVSVRNDAGLFYSVFYQLVGYWLPGPAGARLASALLGGATFLLLAQAIAIVKPLSLARIALLFGSFVLSYQSIFVFVRVRPEAAWWFCAALVLCAIVWYESKSRVKIEAGPLLVLLLATMLLPMNHRLSWFACAFVCGYAMLFLLKERGWRVAATVWLATFAGVILNIVLRAWCVGIPLHDAIVTSMGSTGGQRQPLNEFLELVFHGAPLFLNDTAQNPNLYEWIGGSKAGTLSHAFLQNALWLLLIVVPFFGRSWKERYLLAFPAFALFGFWASGYYNPTYSAGFSLFCVMALAYRAPFVSGWRVKMAGFILALSVVNGLSFISTRVLIHGDASFFAAERTIRGLAESLTPDQKLAVPERFMSVYSGLPVQHFVNFKDDIPTDVDLLVTESYDLLMYGFVPNFDEKKRAQADQARHMCLENRIVTPVYKADYLWGETITETLEKPASWFFRNSAAYALSIYRNCDLRK